MAAGAHQLEIEEISVVPSDEVLAVRLSGLELDGAEGTSGTEQEEGHLVFASADIRSRAFSMEDYRVASSKWDQQMRKNVVRRFYSLAKQDIRAKLSLARGALSMSLTSVHRREVLQQMIDDNLNLAKMYIKLERLEAATVLLRAILKDPEVVRVDRFRGLVLQAEIMEHEGRDLELVGFVSSFLRESSGSEAQRQRAKRMRAHAEERLARRPRKEEKRR